jgi:hypothetical protein
MCGTRQTHPLKAGSFKFSLWIMMGIVVCHSNQTQPRKEGVVLELHLVSTCADACL